MRLVNVTKRFQYSSDDPEVIALESITFAIPAGGFVFLTGPSGAGKSTLVRILYGERVPDSGEAVVAGRNIGRLNVKELALLRREVGVVHQEFHLIGRMSSLENVILPLTFAGIPRKEAKRRAEEALDEVGLFDRRNLVACELSGGEKQRTTVARALVMNPKVIVADEPTGNLDPGFSDEIFKIFERYHEEGGTVLIATHDIRRVDTSPHAALYLEKGRIVSSRGDVEVMI